MSARWAMRDAELFARIDAVLSDFDGQHSDEPAIPVLDPAMEAAFAYDRERTRALVAHLREIGRWPE